MEEHSQEAVKESGAVKARENFLRSPPRIALTWQRGAQVCSCQVARACMMVQPFLARISPQGHSHIHKLTPMVPRPGDIRMLVLNRQAMEMSAEDRCGWQLR